MTNLSSLDYLENFTVSKSLNDRMWKLSFTLDKDEAPTAMTGVRAFATDHASVEHCLFVGFIPGANYIRQSANNKVNITAYDFTWYLSAQKVPREDWELHIVYLGETPGVFINTLLGGVWYGTGNSLNVTGLEFADPLATGDEAWFYWGPQTTKIEAIEEMAEHYERMLYTTFDQSGSAYVPTFHFDYYSNLDLYTPAQVTFTSPSAYITNMNINTNEMETYNRVTVYGQQQFTGEIYEGTAETAEVTAEEEKPIEYVYEDAKINTYTAAHSKAISLLNTLNSISSATYTATLTNRYDLKLLQLVKFVGYSDIPETDMRIISITYQRILNQDSVSITFTADQDFAELKLLARITSDDTIQTQQQVIREELSGLAHIGIGTVTAVDGNEATVEMERSGNTLKARILT